MSVSFSFRMLLTGYDPTSIARFQRTRSVTSIWRALLQATTKLSPGKMLKAEHGRIRTLFDYTKNVESLSELVKTVRRILSCV